MRTAQHAPLETDGRELLVQIRAGFILQGTTLTAWCKRHHKHPQAVRSALYGAWDGPKARALRKQVLKAAGVAA